MLLALANLASSLPLRSFLFIILSCMQFFFSFFFFIFAVSEEGWDACRSREVVARSDVTFGFGLWLFEPSLLEMCAI